MNNAPTTTLLLAAVLASLAACTSDIDAAPRAALEPAATPAEAPPARPITQTLALDSERSSIEFVGAKVTGSHRGSFGQPTGSLSMTADGSYESLSIRIDTDSLEIEPPKLEQHLQSADFFDVERYPSATFELISVEERASENGTHSVVGDLSLHGKTQRLSFPATISRTDDGVEAKSSFSIDRRDFDITYKGMADDLIKNDVLLEMDLRFGPEA